MFYAGTVENRYDPLKLGRCQVRIVGLHTHDKLILPTADLPWAYPLQPITSAALSGIGDAPVGPVEGTWVLVVFNDEAKQMPIMIGTIGGIPQEGTQLKVEDDNLSIKIMGDVVTSNGQSSTVETSTSQRLKRAAELTMTQDAIDLYNKYHPVQPGEVAIPAEQLLAVSIPVIQGSVRAVLTQSMFDALITVADDLGDTWLASEVLKCVNAGKYTEAATAINLLDNNPKRPDQSELFLKDGIPNEAGEISKPGQGDHTEGFKDPNGKYPLYFAEPDTNRLARHEEIGKTIVYKKEAARDEGVEGPQGITWSQPELPYNAQYPFNHVTATESGHVFEMDDTPNSERIHLYHKSGTFTEIDANGTQVNRIIGDGFQILERNGYIHIQGNSNVTIEGANNVLVKGAMKVDINGQADINCFNDVNLNVSGSLNAAVGEDINLFSGAALKIEAASIDIKSDGAVHIEAAGTTDILSGGNVMIEGPQVRMAEGADGADTTGLSAPGDRKDAKEINLAELKVVTRGAEAGGQYETPEEVSASPDQQQAYQKKQIDTGSIRQEDLNKGANKAEAAPPANNKTPPAPGCDIINKTEKFDTSFQLSQNFTLGGLTKGGSRMVVPQVGLTPQQIVCNLKGLCENILEPYRKVCPNLIITSGFRRPGDVPASSKTSQHYNGEAVDIVIPSLDRKGHYELIQKFQQLVPFDQLILEYSGKTTVWIHTSFSYSNPKKQYFTMRDHHRIGNFGQFILIE